ncbi:hypothetical protein TrLO_g2831 [Triparma laevis f. longispina]|uniref:EF-hand domain-containing protein n=1 Tax=Triparma laevis f. longispina TaxID=1714387 RepID=A0A9W7F9U9_9STRA|nr:hypothetical protein TrLO_g2831 [Triparma laevis f. longispina]
MLLPLTLPSGKPTFFLRNSVKAGALLCLLGGYTFYNQITDERFYPTTVHDDGRALEEACEYPNATEPKGTVVVYIGGVMYMFIALAIICDEFFVPALEVIGSKWKLSNDIAGATLMAAGGSAPELFTALTGTFEESAVGFGTVVGSAVFNVMFVIGVCAVASSTPLELTWWPLTRDCSYYALCLYILSIFMGDGEIYWYEALCLLGLYGGYVTIMAFNVQLHRFVLERILKMDNVTVEMALAEKSEDDVSLLKPTGFRAGLYSFMTGKGSLAETAGTAIVTQITGDVNETFKKIDTNGNGKIEVSEIGNLLKEVSGAKVTPNEVRKVMEQIDVDKAGEIDLASFTSWYLSSQHRIEKDVKSAFNSFDSDKSGTLTKDEVRAALKEAAILAMSKGRTSISGSMAADTVTFEQFKKFYMDSELAARRQSCMEEQGAAAEGIKLSLPSEGGLGAKIMFIITLPLVLCMYPIPDVRRPGKNKYCYISFLGSIAYIGIFSFFMVKWATTVGDTFRIPPIVMGLTFLAAGTSVPDLLSSVIVAKQGHGDMAVSSSIGSNIFDILVGLPFPWLLYTLYHSGDRHQNVPVTVGAENLEISLFILIAMLMVVIGTIALFKWRMRREMGYFYFVLYFIYVGQELIRTKWC